MMDEKKKDEIRGYEEQPIKDLIEKIDSNLKWMIEDAVNTDRENLKQSYKLAMDQTIVKLQEAKLWAQKMLDAMAEPQIDTDAV